MKQLLRRREKMLARLLELAPKILLGETSETYRTCGAPSCRCHTTGPKHGPHTHVNYKGQDGRTTGYYVRKALVERVTEGIAARKEMRTLLRDLAHLNKEIMDAEHPEKTRAKQRS
jgi:hypothetical protein